MRKFLLPLTIAVLCFGLLSCNESWKDKTADAISKVVTPTIAEIASCSGTDAIRSDLKDRIRELPWLKEDKVKQAMYNKSIGSALCRTVVSAVVPLFVDFAVGAIAPAEWECTGDFASTSLTEFAKLACSTIQI